MNGLRCCYICNNICCVNMYAYICTFYLFIYMPSHYSFSLRGNEQAPYNTHDTYFVVAVNSIWSEPVSIFLGQSRTRIGCDGLHKLYLLFSLLHSYCISSPLSLRGYATPVITLDQLAYVYSLQTQQL